jgi:hypothetical protein
VDPAEFRAHALFAAGFGDQLILHPIVGGQAALERPVKKLLSAVDHVVKDVTLGRLSDSGIGHGGGDDKRGGFTEHPAVVFHFFTVTAGEETKSHLLGKAQRVRRVILSSPTGAIGEFEDCAADVLVEGMFAIRAYL